jgi:uncharacterized membrane protein
MKPFWIGLKIVLALFMVYAGVQHFINPTTFQPFVPNFLPFKLMIVYFSGLLEIALGVLLFLPKYSRWGATGIIWLMIVFLPIHIWDIFIDEPAIGSHKAAMIRLPIQFILIGIAWAIRKYATQ